MQVPKHIGVIIDGNRRFAKLLGEEEAWKGHEYGYEKVEEFLDWCKEYGIKCVTIWAFSTENFKRDEEEKRAIFRLIKRMGESALTDKRVSDYKIRLNIIGNIDLFPEDVRKSLQQAMGFTKNNKEFFVNVALAYGGKQEILDAAAKLSKDVSEGKVKPEEITQEVFERYTYSKDIPPVDLIIRTSGEQRHSGFLLWKSDYAEFYFCDKFWPQFEKEDLLKALVSYSERQRRFGK